MKVCELYDHVAQLGFEDNLLEYDRHFVLTANRALYEVAALRPQTGSVLVHHEPLENMINNSSFAPLKKTDDIIFTEDGAKAFYFEALGHGTCHVERFNVTMIGTYLAASEELTAATLAAKLGISVADLEEKISGTGDKHFSGIELDTVCHLLDISRSDLFTDCFPAIVINSPSQTYP